MSPIETHPYNVREPTPKGTRKIIVGTAPPPRFSNPACGGMERCDFDFYYGSSDNYMWEFLDEIASRRDGCRLFDNGFTSDQCVFAARSFLMRHNIWMRDILEKYQRKEGRECSSDDGHIIWPANECTDFGSLFTEHRSLETVAFTSERAAKWTFSKLIADGLVQSGAYDDALVMRREAEKDAALLQDYIAMKFKRSFCSVDIGGRQIQFFILPAPLARSRKKGFKKHHKLAIYEEILFDSL